MPLAQLNITVLKSGLQSGNESYGPFSVQNTATVPGSTLLTSINGDNTITVPTGAIGCLIIPPNGSALVKKLKGIGGDTGVAIHPANASVVGLASSQATFILNVSGVEQIEIVWF